MWWFIKTTLVVDRGSVEYFGLFPTREDAEEYVVRCFDREDVDVEYFQMVPVDRPMNDEED